MPKLWADTVEEHRQAVRAATMDAAARLVARRGLASVTMSAIAEEAGLGRATLYKYFPDVQAILTAWHERQVSDHLEHLSRVRDQDGSPGQRLRAVLTAYALKTWERPHGAELAALLRRGDHITQAHQQLSSIAADLLTEAARAGEVRDDVPPDELAGFCLHALTAASGLPSRAAVERLVGMTLSGVRPVPAMSGEPGAGSVPPVIDGGRAASRSPITPPC